MKRIYSQPLSEVLRKLPVAAELQNTADQLISMIEHPSFYSRIKERDRLRKIAEKEQERFKKLNSGSSEVFFDLQARRDYHLAFDKMRRIDKELGEMKDRHAELAAQLFEEPQEHDLPIPDGAWTVGEFPSGSAEWLRQRQPTLGGSDVGSIVRIDPEYGESNYTETRKSKLDRDPQSQDHSGAAARGDIWEPALISALSLALKDNGITGEVFVNKNTMRNETSHANLDGFIVDDEAIVAIAECKTSSFPDEWTENMIPYGYVFQTQHYMNFYGLSKAYLVANIDDQTISVYEISLDDTVPASEWLVKALLRDQGLSASAAKNIFDSYLLHGVDSEYYSHISSLINVKYSDVKKIAENMVAKWDQERKGKEKPRRRTCFTKAWKGPWENAIRKGIVYLDLETSGMSPKSGYIIEVGALREDGERFDELFGVPDDHAFWNGTGMVEVHHITLEDIKGKPVLIFSDEWIAKLREFIGDRVIVAHNAMFEKRWLSEIFPEFEYADTMHIFSSFVKESPNNKMASFVAWAGLDYKNAHRAFNDAEMMRDAYKITLEETIEFYVETKDSLMQLYGEDGEMEASIAAEKEAFKFHKNLLNSKGIPLSVEVPVIDVTDIDELDDPADKEF